MTGVMSKASEMYKGYINMEELKINSSITGFQNNFQNK